MSFDRDSSLLPNKDTKRYLVIFILDWSAFKRLDQYKIAQTNLV